MNLLLNGADTEEYYCHEHEQWNLAGDESNCCAMEMEED